MDGGMENEKQKRFTTFMAITYFCSAFKPEPITNIPGKNSLTKRFGEKFRVTNTHNQGYPKSKKMFLYFEFLKRP